MMQIQCQVPLAISLELGEVCQKLVSFLCVVDFMHLGYIFGVIPNMRAVNSKEECIAADTTILEKKHCIVAEDYSAQNMNITKR